MTVKELRDALVATPTDLDHLQIEVWLPGSRIRLSGQPFANKGSVLIEGNVNPGSALCR